MDQLRLDTLAAQVVAWHNRHPLARRITAAQVHSMGYVLLPGVAPRPALAAAAAEAAPVLTDVVAAEAPPLAEEGQRQSAAELAAEVQAQAKQSAPEPAAQVAADAPLAPAEAAADAPASSAEAASPETPAETATVAPVEFEAVPIAPPADAAAQAPAAASATAAPDQPPPAAPAAAGSLREKLAARRAGAAPVAASAAAAPAPPTGTEGLRLAFSEPFFEHASPERVARWAQQHARVLAAPLPAGAPVRRVRRDPALGALRAAEQPVDLLLRTATVELGNRRLRLLVGPGDSPAVLGPHLWSHPRWALAATPLAALPVGLALAWGLMHAPPDEPAGPQLAAAASAAPGAASAAASAAAGPVPVSAHAQAPAASAASAAGDGAAPAWAHNAVGGHPPVARAQIPADEYPDDVDPELGRVELPPIGPLHGDPFLEPTRLRRQAARAARAAAAQASAPQGAESQMAHVDAASTVATAAAVAPAAHGSAGHAPAPPSTTAPPQAAARTSDSTMPAAPALPPEYALTTRLLRTAAESEMLQAAMEKLLQAQGGSTLRVHRIPVGDDWRVVGGTFASRASAEQMRALLLARGVKTELVDLSAPLPAPAAQVARR